MSEPALARPEFLGPLAALLGLTALALFGARRRARRRARALLGPRAPRPAGLAADWVLLLALFAVAVALLGPRWGSRTLLVPVSGVDVTLLLDVSPSMLARDVPPSRLDRARDAARRVLAGLAPGDRVALAVFSGRGVLLAPLTPDAAALTDLLPALEPALMQEQGSRLAEGIEAALAAFEDASPRPRALFVLGDGEDPERTPLPEDSLRRARVRAVAALFGSEAGALVPEHDGWLRDAWGRNVTSRRELAPLASLAAQSDGHVLLADRWGEIDIAEAVAALRRDAGRGPGELAVRRVPRERGAPFAAAAFLLLLLELAVSGRRLRPASAPVWALAIALAAGSALAVTPLGRAELEARVRRDPEDARALLALGVARAQADELDEAARALFAAAARAREPQLAAHAYYDLAVVELERGRLESARDAFYDALALAPRDLEAKFNLEWTLRRLRSVPPAGATRPAEPPGAAREEPRPRASESAEPEVRMEAPPEAAPAEKARAEVEAPELEAEEARRWLERVPDDPSPSLREAVRRAGAGQPRPPRTAPRW